MSVFVVLLCLYGSGARFELFQCALVPVQDWLSSLSVWFCVPCRLVCRVLSPPQSSKRFSDLECSSPAPHFGSIS